MPHTPRPWTIERRDRVGYTTITIGHEDAERACMVCEVGNELRQENVDNANLIAAAPDLLAALEDIIPLLVQFFPRNEKPEEWVQAIAARTAIRKATEGV